VGQAVSVAGAGASGAPLYSTIVSVSGTSATLAVAASTTVSGVAVALTGHPDLLYSTVGDANGIVWQNVGTSYSIVNGSESWQAIAGISKDVLYTVTGNAYASKYGVAMSTNSYGQAPTYTKQADSGQDTGAWLMEYDAVPNAYHLLNTFTGIWTDRTCSLGNASDYKCTGGTWNVTTVGPMAAITHPYSASSTQACPEHIHDAKMSRNGKYIEMVGSVNQFYPACVSLQDFYLWQTSAANYDTLASLQITEFGMSHWAIGMEHVVVPNSSGWGYPDGIFLGVYQASNVHGDNGASYYAPGGGYPPPVSLYMLPFSNQSQAQTYPPGCYVTTGSGSAEVIKNPDCDHSQFSDSHISWVGDPGTDTWPACGTTYNFATLSPIPFNAWQGMETCYPTSPTYPSGAPAAGQVLPVPGCTTCSFGSVWQFTHNFGVGTNLDFATQFEISQYSQDANWLFFSSDWNCQNGSTTGSAPSVYAGSGPYYQEFAVSPVPSGASSLCGQPWQAGTAYVAGNVINPIETASVAGGADDVFQALTSGTSGPQSNLSGNQPECGAASCFASTNPPTATPAAVTAAIETGNSAVITTANALTLNPGVFITLAGMTPGGYNGTWTVTSASGSSFTVTGLPAGLGSATAFGTATAQGDTVCDSATGTGNLMNPPLPYSTSCAGGVVWQDLGPQTQRGDVFAVNLGLN